MTRALERGKSCSWMAEEGCVDKIQPQSIGFLANYLHQGALEMKTPKKAELSITVHVPSRPSFPLVYEYLQFLSSNLSVNLREQVKKEKSDLKKCSRKAEKREPFSSFPASTPSVA